MGVKNVQTWNVISRPLTIRVTKRYDTIRWFKTLTSLVQTPEILKMCEQIFERFSPFYLYAKALSTFACM